MPAAMLSYAIAMPGAMLLFMPSAIDAATFARRCRELMPIDLRRAAFAV